MTDRASLQSATAINFDTPSSPINLTAFLNTASNRDALSIDAKPALEGSVPALICGKAVEENPFPEVGVGVLLPSSKGDKGWAAEDSRLREELAEAAGVLAVVVSTGGEVGIAYG